MNCGMNQGHPARHSRMRGNDGSFKSHLSSYEGALFSTDNPAFVRTGSRICVV